MKKKLAAAAGAAGLLGLTYGAEKIRSKKEDYERMKKREDEHTEAYNEIRQSYMRQSEKIDKLESKIRESEKEIKTLETQLKSQKEADDQRIDNLTRQVNVLNIRGQYFANEALEAAQNMEGRRFVELLQNTLDSGFFDGDEKRILLNRNFLKVLEKFPGREEDLRLWLITRGATGPPLNANSRQAVPQSPPEEDNYWAMKSPISLRKITRKTSRKVSNKSRKTVKKARGVSKKTSRKLSMKVSGKSRKSVKKASRKVSKKTSRKLSMKARRVSKKVSRKVARR